MRILSVGLVRASDDSCNNAVHRPRVRADGREVLLPTFQALAHTDPLTAL